MSHQTNLERDESFEAFEDRLLEPNQSTMELRPQMYDSCDITMNLERSLCNSIMLNAFGFTKKVEILVANVLSNSELKNRYSDINRLPFYAFVSQELCRVVQKLSETYSTFIDGFLTDFETQDKDYLLNQIRKLEDGLKKSKIKFSESYKG